VTVIVLINRRLWRPLTGQNIRHRKTGNGWRPERNAGVPPAREIITRRAVNFEEEGETDLRGYSGCAWVPAFQACSTITF
jgi:hypothetical protein